MFENILAFHYKQGTKSTKMQVTDESERMRKTLRKENNKQDSRRKMTIVIAFIFLEIEER